jgi:hypothetical protein
MIGKTGKIGIDRRLQEHIDALCLSFGIIVMPAWGARRCRAYFPRTVWIMPIRSYLSYAIALHEIGHCRTFWRAGRVFRIAPYEIIDRAQETLAWQWAREQALEWTEPMEWAYNFSRQYAKRATW